MPDQSATDGQTNNSVLRSNLKDSPKSGPPRGPPSPKGLLHVKFQIGKESGNNGEATSSKLLPNQANIQHFVAQSKAVKQLDFEEPAGKISSAKRSTVFERFEKRLKNDQSQAILQEDLVKSKQAEKEKSNETANVKERSVCTAGSSPKIHEGLIKKLEPNKEKSRRGDFKVAAKMHKRQGNKEGPLPMKAKLGDMGKDTKSDTTRTDVERPLSRENSGEFLLRRPGSRASSNESLNCSESGPMTSAGERSPGVENASEDGTLGSGNETGRCRNLSGGSDADAAEDALAVGLRRQAVRRAESGGSEPEELSPASTAENAVSVKDRSPSPASGMVRKGSHRKRRTASGSDDNDSIRDILPDRHELVTNRRRLSGEFQNTEPVNRSPSSLRSASDGAVEKSKTEQNRTGGRRVASDSSIQSRILFSADDTSGQQEVSDSSGELVQAADPGGARKNRIPIGERPSHPALSRSERGRQSERVKVAKKEVNTSKRSSSVGASANRNSSVLVDKPPLAKPVPKSGDRNAEGIKSARSASKEELRKR